MKNAIADKELIAEQLKKQMSPEDQAIVKKMSAAQKDELFAGNADYSAALSNEKAVTKEWGMGGDSNRALNAVTIAITVASGGQTDLQVVTNTHSTVCSSGDWRPVWSWRGRKYRSTVSVPCDLRGNTGLY